MRFLLALLLLTSAAQAIEPLSDTDPQIIVGDQAATVGEHVINLPEDAGKFYLTCFTEVRLSPHSRAILDWFNTDPQLAKLVKQTHWHHLNKLSGIWSRYDRLTQSVPCVVIHDPLGKVVFKASGDSCHLDSAAALKRAISAQIVAYRDAKENCRPFRPCPDEPDQPDDEPDYTPDKPAIPDTPDEPRPDQREVPLDVVYEEEHHEALIAAGLGCVALLGAALIAYLAQRNRQA